MNKPGEEWLGRRERVVRENFLEEMICMLEQGDEPRVTLGTGRWLRPQDRNR